MEKTFIEALWHLLDRLKFKPVSKLLIVAVHNIVWHFTYNVLQSFTQLVYCLTKSSTLSAMSFSSMYCTSVWQNRMFAFGVVLSNRSLHICSSTIIPLPAWLIFVFIRCWNTNKWKNNLHNKKKLIEFINDFDELFFTASLVNFWMIFQLLSWNFLTFSMILSILFRSLWEQTSTAHLHIYMSKITSKNSEIEHVEPDSWSIYFSETIWPILLFFISEAVESNK